MSRHVAIVIGVASSGDLPELPGAREDAGRAAAWAEANGYEVTRLVDDDGPIAAAAVFEAVRSAVDAGDVDRLVLFFAGHGVSKGSALDFWLLSAGPANPNESVNVDASLRLARTSGIPHVAVFADACRSAVGQDRLGMEGYVVFPDAGLDLDVEVDRFLAARPGFVALEQAATDAVAAHGLFTDRLLAALDDPPAPAVEPAVDEDGREVVALTAGSLKRWLVEAVEDASVTLSTAQTPDCVVGSTPPRHIYRVVEEVPTATVTVTIAGGRGEPPVLRVFANSGGRTFDLVHEGAPRATVEVPVGTRLDVEVERDGTLLTLAEPGLRTVTGDDEFVVRIATAVRSIRPPDATVDAIARATRAVVVTPDGSPALVAPDGGRHDVVDVHPVLGWTGRRRVVLAAGDAPSPLRSAGGNGVSEDVLGLAGRVDAAVRGVATTSHPAGLVVRRAAWPSPLAVTCAGGVVDHEVSPDGVVVAARGRVEPAVVRLDDDHHLVVELWPGQVGVVLVDDGVDGPSVAAVVHVPTGMAPSRVDDVAAHAGAAVAAAQAGALPHLAAPGASIHDLVPDAGPTLAGLVAHGLDASGRLAELDAVATALRDRHGDVGADVAVLVGASGPDTLPTLTADWAFLPRDLPAPVAAARAALAPGLYATVVGPAGSALAAHLATST